MNKLYTLCLCYACMVVNCTVSAAAPPAGIVIYASTNDDVYILLADHRDPSERGWAGFGGGADEGETLAVTAARETEAFCWHGDAPGHRRGARQLTQR